jgi:hypothetical protein
MKLDIGVAPWMLKAWHLVEADGRYIAGPFFAKKHAEILHDLPPACRLSPGLYAYKRSGQAVVYVGRIRSLRAHGIWS